MDESRSPGLPEGALTGVKVLDLSRLLPGPYCSMILADHGAEVLAIEDRRFQADGMFFQSLNRNKRHMSLNLKSAEGRDIFFALARDADVILEGFRPGVVDRLGVGYSDVAKVNPGIIYCSISSYGQDGPLRERVGHDVNFISKGGLLGLIGEAGRTPVIPGVQIGDIAGGSMNAAIGILMALYAREKSGKGQYIDISMADGVVGLLTLPHSFAQANSHAPERGDWQLSHRYAFYNVYETQDGRYLAIGAVENRFWSQLCELLDRPQYGPLQFDEEKRLDIIEDLRRIFLGRPLAEWETLLGNKEVCYSAVATIGDVFNDPLFVEREIAVSYTSSDGRTVQDFGIPIKLSATPGCIRTPPGNFGEHTREVLTELGLSQDTIDDYTARGVL